MSATGRRTSGRLRRSDCSGPGITRRRSGRGFRYLTSEGDAVADAEVLERIDALAIPPAWQDVWICAEPNGHIQATGIDAAGRRQYRYHDRWRARRDAEKYDRMLRLARRLPAVRRRNAARMRPGPDGELSRDQVLAGAVRLLDLGFFRVGNDAYADENGSFGLMTLERRHVSLEGRTVHFDYPAKSGVRRRISVRDPTAAKLVEQLLDRRRGPRRLFTLSENGGWAKLDAAALNAYIKEIAGDEFTAKDFRTWNATVLAAVALSGRRDAARGKTSRKRAVSAAIKEVAEQLGNTPAVCRASYVDPRVIDRFADGDTIEPQLLRSRTATERAVIALIEDE
jgi:DNA topoisomerase IB